MAFAEDLSAFFDPDGFAVRATWGALTANVIYSAPGEILLDGEVVSNDHTADLPASNFPGIKRGDAVAIEGHGTFVVREPARLLDDGAIKRLTLSKA